MNVLLWVVGLASSVFAIWQFNEYSKQATESQGFWPHMVLAIVGIAVACVCAFIWFYKKTKEQADQDISITKF
jgi:hypothetical protein